MALKAQVISKPQEQPIIDWSERTQLKTTAGQAVNAVGNRPIIDLAERQQTEDEHQLSGVVVLLLLTTLLLAIFLDIFGIISLLVDIPTAGIVGWIIRLVMSLINLVYLSLFFYLSYRPEFGGGQVTAMQARAQARQLLRTVGRWLPRLLRIIGVAEIGTDLIPIIGSIIEALPIETLSVVLFFFIWPRLKQHFEQSAQSPFKEVEVPA